MRFRVGSRTTGIRQRRGNGLVQAPEMGAWLFIRTISGRRDTSQVPGVSMDRHSPTRTTTPKKAPGSAGAFATMECSASCSAKGHFQPPPNSCRYRHFAGCRKRPVRVGGHAPDSTSDSFFYFTRAWKHTVTVGFEALSGRILTLRTCCVTPLVVTGANVVANLA